MGGPGSGRKKGSGKGKQFNVGAFKAGGSTYSTTKPKKPGKSTAKRIGTDKSGRPIFGPGKLTNKMRKEAGLPVK